MFMSCCKLCLIESVGLWLWLDILTLLQALSLLHSLAAELHFDVAHVAFCIQLMML